MKSMSIRLSLATLGIISITFTSCKKDNDDDPFGADVIEICEKQDDELRLKNHKSGVDYRVICDLNITSGKLIVEEGVTIAVVPEKAIRVYDSGSIQVEGTESDPVTFQPTEEAAGASWGGIIISNNNAANSIENVVIDRAGAVNRNSDMAFNVPFSIEAGFALNGRCSINGIHIKESGGEGIYISPQSNLVSFENIKVENSGSYPLVIPVVLVKSFEGGATYTGNTPNKIFTWGSILEETHTWIFSPIPYLLSEDLNLNNATLNIMQGVVIEVETDKGIYVPAGSSLRLDGTTGSPVIIRGKENFPGWWKGILVESNSPANIWLNVDISNAGSSPLTGFDSNIASVYLGGPFNDATSLSATNIFIHDGDGCGIIKKSATSYGGTNVSFSNTDGEICDL